MSVKEATYIPQYILHAPVISGFTPGEPSQYTVEPSWHLIAGVDTRRAYIDLMPRKQPKKTG
jgi:hypothetical protein